MVDDDIRAHVDAVPGYCNTASVGIPPRAAVEVLRQMARLSRGVVVVQDLARSWWGYCGFSLVAAVRLSRMTLHDGRVSFRQAYTAAELAALARQAGLVNYRVSAPGRFRLGLTIWPIGESNGG